MRLVELGPVGGGGADTVPRYPPLVGKQWQIALVCINGFDIMI